MLYIFFFFFFSNFYVFYPITEYRCPCKSSAFFSSRSNNFSLSLSLFIFILIWSFFQFRSFSIFSLPFFRVSFRVFFFPSSSLYLKSKREKKKKRKEKRRKRCRVEHVTLSTRLIVTYALFVITALCYYCCRYSDYNYELLCI